MPHIRFVPYQLIRVLRLGLIALILGMMQPLTASSQGISAILPTNCVADAPKFAGITHCVLTGEKNTHVVLVNLETTGLRFETALPMGPNGQECKDVNIPQWAVPGRGCIVGNAYPFESVSQIAGRYPGVSVAINTDYYGVDDRPPVHGAEGLVVKNGQRFDGWELGDCDGNKLDRTGKPYDPKKPTPCDGNDVKRPSMIISRDNRSINLGYRTGQELDNKSVFTDRIYNAVGGGPLIVRQGIAQPNTACRNDAGLPQGRVCDVASQMAVGLSGDGKTLIIAMADRDAAGTAKLYTDTFKEYNVQTALKLDGGGSPTLWYGGQTFGTTGSGGNRAVGEALLIFASVAREWDATPANPSDFAVSDPGKPVTLNLTFTNTGTRAWNTPDLAVVNVNNQPLGANSTQRVGGTRQIVTGGKLPLTISLQAPANPGLYTSEWQLKSNDQLLGTKVTFYVIVLPPEAKDLREKIQQEIDQWRKSGEQKVDELLRQIQQQVKDWLAKQGQDLAKQLLQQGQDLAKQLLQQAGCTTSLALITMLLLAGWLMRS